MKMKKRRDCTKCIAYCNLLPGSMDRCGFGFEYQEELEISKSGMKVAVHPVDDKCESIDIPRTRDAFVKTAAALGVEWDINDVITLDDYEQFGW